MIGRYTTRATNLVITEKYIILSVKKYVISSFVVIFGSFEGFGDKMKYPAGVSGTMPLGNPCGLDDFEYTDEGLPYGLSMATVPVSSLSRASFYTDLLGMEVVEKGDGFVVLRRSSCLLMLRVSENYGIDTGIFLAVDSPFRSRCRLMDEGVIFTREPTRGPFGVYASFRDDDGNVLHAMEPPSKSE